MKTWYQLPLATSMACCLALAGCSSDSTTSSNDDDLDSGGDESSEDSSTSTTGGLNPTLFASAGLSSDPELVDCTLSDGTETQCYQFTTVGVPATHDVGPFCPESIDSNSDNSGIWLDGDGTVYQLDGDFILDLPNIYGDSNWQLYDTTTGLVNITDTQVACEAAARPDVDPDYQNHCVECSLDYVDGGVSSTFLIPAVPVPATTNGSIGMQVGLALSGIQLEAPAPVSDILANYTIAAFDDCGGHVNPTEGYHYHAATGCTTSAFESDGHAGLIGYALDGYGIYGELDSDGNESTGLDDCRGSTDDTRGYHYHAASPGENMFIGCYHGKTVEDSSAAAGGPPGGEPPAGGPPQ